MSAGIDVGGTITQALWKPKLIRLTQIGNPDYNDGLPTICFLDPATITSISVAVAAFNMRADPAKRHPDVSCTAVFFCHGTLHVTESPEQVAAMRDSALGYKQELKTV